MEDLTTLHDIKNISHNLKYIHRLLLNCKDPFSWSALASLTAAAAWFVLDEGSDFVLGQACVQECACSRVLCLLRVLCRVVLQALVEVDSGGPRTGLSYPVLQLLLQAAHTHRTFLREQRAAQRSSKN